MIKGTVLMVKGDKLLLVANHKYYISKGNGDVGDQKEFDETSSLLMPSYMFAIAAMEEENLDETLNFIQNEWFKK